MRTIDVHAHYVPPGVLEAVRRQGGRYDAAVVEGPSGEERISFGGRFTTAPLFPEMFERTERLRAMDASEIDVQVVCTWIDLAGYALDPEAGRAWARAVNEAMADDLRGNDRLVGLATVPLQDGAAAAAELEYGIRTLGLRGVEIGANVNGQNLDEPGLEPFWTKAEDLDAFVFVHPHPPSWRERLGKYFLFNLIGYPLDSTIAQAALIFGGVMERFPGLKLLFVHGGGFLPYQIGRLDRGYKVNPAAQTIPRPPGEYFDRFYFDTVVHRTGTLAFLLRNFGAGRVLLGTDYPFGMADPEAVARVREIRSISEEQRKLVLGENARRLLGVKGDG